MWIDNTQFIHSSADGHLGCSQFCGITNEAVVIICAQVFVWTPVFIPLRSERNLGVNIAGSYGKCTFNFLGNCQTVSAGAVPFTFPSAREEGSSFSPSSPAPVLVCPFQLLFLREVTAPDIDGRVTVLRQAPGGLLPRLCLHDPTSRCPRHAPVEGPGKWTREVSGSGHR